MVEHLELVLLQCAVHQGTVRIQYSYRTISQWDVEVLRPFGVGALCECCAAGLKITGAHSLWVTVLPGAGLVCIDSIELNCFQAC